MSKGVEVKSKKWRNVVLVIISLAFVSNSSVTVSAGVSRVEVYEIFFNSSEYYDDYYGLTVKGIKYFDFFENVLIGGGSRYTIYYHETYKHLLALPIYIRSNISKYNHFPFVFVSGLFDVYFMENNRTLGALGYEYGIGHNFGKIEINLARASSIYKYVIFEIGMKF